MKTILELIFLDEIGKEFKLRIPNPKETLEEIQIESAADNIVANNIFISNNTKLVRIESARIVKTTIDNIEF